MTGERPVAGEGRIGLGGLPAGVRGRGRSRQQRRRRQLSVARSSPHLSKVKEIISKQIDKLGDIYKKK